MLRVMMMVQLSFFSKQRMEAVLKMLGGSK